MPTLLLDGRSVEVAAFCASTPAGFGERLSREEAAGAYRLDLEHRDGSVERWWSEAVGVGAYRLLRRITAGGQARLLPEGEGAEGPTRWHSNGTVRR